MQYSAFRHFLKRSEACYESLSWLDTHKYDSCRAWGMCTRPDWLIWLMIAVDLPRSTINEVVAACAAATDYKLVDLDSLNEKYISYIDGAINNMVVATNLFPGELPWVQMMLVKHTLSNIIKNTVPIHKIEEGIRRILFDDIEETDVKHVWGTDDGNYWFSDEADDLNGPFFSKELAKEALDEYCRHL